jgi:hypothetical protein
MIHARMVGILNNGTVLLRCGDCGTGPNDDAYTASTMDAAQVLMVCMSGHPLGEWDTVEQREAELAAFRENILQHHAPVKKKAPAKHSSKAESKSRSMWGGGSASVKKRPRPKQLRKRGYK